MVGIASPSTTDTECPIAVFVARARSAVLAHGFAVDDRSTRVIVIAGGEDRWGVGARSAIARIFDAVDRLDDPKYHPNRFGPNLVNAAFQLTLFRALLAGGLYVWFSLTR
jgi:hypothetical protein